MVSSVNGSSYNLSQLMMFYQQQQAQLGAANNADLIQNSGGSSGATQDTSSANNNSLISSPSLGLESLLSLLQTQQVTTPEANTDTSGQSTGQPDSFQQDFQGLVSSITSGDLTGAQQAYAALSQLQSANSANNPNTSTAGQSGQSPFQQALSQIGSDLQAGNMSGAQQTLASLQQTQQAEGGHHHHHHGGGGGDLASLLDGVSSSTSSSSSNSSSSSTTQPLTVTNADGSVTTITTNADGSVTTTTTPATQMASSGSPVNPLQDLLAALEQKFGAT